MTQRGANTPNDILVRRLRSLPKVLVQNGLMRTGDRQIALSMMYMRDTERAYVFSLLPHAKVSRIQEELKLQNRLRITYDQYKKAVAAVSEGIARDRGTDSVKSYIRPVR